MVLLVDEAAIASGPTGGTLSGSVFLTAGLHAVKVRSTAGAFTVNSVTVTAQGAPASPVITTVSTQNLSATATWSSVPGAAGYVLLYGTSPGPVHQPAGRRRRHQRHGQRSRRTTSPTTSPSAPMRRTGPRACRPPPQSVHRSGCGTNRRAGPVAVRRAGERRAVRPLGAPPTATAAGVTVGPLTLGPGLIPAMAGSRSGTPTSSAAPRLTITWAQTLSAAIAANQYYQFTVSATPGNVLNLNQLQLQAWFSNYTHRDRWARRAIQHRRPDVLAPPSTSGQLNNAAGLDRAAGRGERLAKHRRDSDLPHLHLRRKSLQPPPASA